MSEEHDYIIINSKDRYNTDLDNCRLLIKGQINGYYAINKIIMTNNFYNVSSNNNQIYFTDSVTSRIGTISPGFYVNNTDYCTAIKSAMDTASGVNTYTVTIDDNNKLTIAQNAATYSFSFSTNTLNSANKIMGFNQTDTSLTLSKTSDNPIDLNYPKVFFIDISSNHIVNTYVTTLFSFSFMIPNNAVFGSLISYEDNDNTSLYINFRNTRDFFIKFYDEYGKQISLNGSEYILILRRPGLKFNELKSSNNMSHYAKVGQSVQIVDKK